MCLKKDTLIYDHGVLVSQLSLSIMASSDRCLLLKLKNSAPFVVDFFFCPTVGAGVISILQIEEPRLRKIFACDAL